MNDKENIIVLGCTGSIGTQCLDILRFSSSYSLVGVSLGSRTEILEKYLLYFDHLKYVAIVDEDKAEDFQRRHHSLTVFKGADSSVQLINACKDSNVFNSIVGNAGLIPTLTAIRNNQDVMLSNKESMVIGSSLIREEMKNSSSHIYPVDSEHVALAKCLAEAKRRKASSVDKLVITASGGALRDYPKDKLADVTPEEVLHHPTWPMGSKITVDCSTLVNKGFEIIEAMELFGYKAEDVDAIICRESLIHAYVLATIDGKQEKIEEYSPCDMKVAIFYALSKGTERIHLNNEDDLNDIQKLHIQEIDHSFYPLFDLTKKTFTTYGNAGMIYYNAVDTKAIDAFLKKEISFLELCQCLQYIFSNMPSLPVLTKDNVHDVIRDADIKACDVVSVIKERR